MPRSRDWGYLTHPAGFMVGKDCVPYEPFSVDSRIGLTCTHEKAILKTVTVYPVTGLNRKATGGPFCYVESQ